MTFDTPTYADAWIGGVRTDIQRERWESPDAAKTNYEVVLLLRDYSASWLKGRDLSGSTRKLYRIILDTHILPAFGETPVTEITPAMVREWHAKLRTETGPPQRPRAYPLPRTVLNTASADELI